MVKKFGQGLKGIQLAVPPLICLKVVPNDGLDARKVAVQCQGCRLARSLSTAGIFYHR